MNVLLLRHGATALNAAGCYQGALDTPLSDAGARDLRPPDAAAERVYVSPLQRARQTAALWFPGAAQTVVRDFREMDFGAFEGKSFRDLAEDRAYRVWVESGCTSRTPAGEDKASFCARTCAAFARLMEEWVPAEELLVIVAHGGTQMAVLERWGLPRRDYFDWRAPLGGGFLLDASDWPRAHTLTYLKTVTYTKGGGL